MEPTIACTPHCARPVRSGFYLPAAMAATLLILLGAPGSADAASKEHEVKAAFLFHFAQFVEWPASAFADADAPFCIGVLGDDPFGDTLDQIVNGESIRHRHIVIKRSKQVSDLKGCQILFVSDSEKDRIEQILSTLDDANVLTVGETDGFAAHGGVINFYLDDNKVRFEINPDAAKRHALKLSSQLLGLGRIVR